MTGFDLLVVGVDGSDMSAEALRWAVDRLAENGRIHVVHALSPLKTLGIAAMQKDSAPVRREAEQVLDGPWTEIARRGGCDVETHLIDDDPADALLQVARAAVAASSSEVSAGTGRSGAIVVGAHGLGDNRHFLGGVTRKLLHHSDVPVVVIKPERPGSPQAERPVLACIGYGEATEDAAWWAADFAAASGAPLILLHTVGYRPIFPMDSPTDTIGGYLGPEVAQDWARADLERLKGEVQVRHPGLVVKTKVDVGFAVRSIGAASADAQLVVLGKRHSNPLSRGIISPRIQQLVVRALASTAVVPSCSTDR